MTTRFSQTLFRGTLFLMICFISLSNSRVFAQEDTEFVTPHFEKQTIGSSTSTAYFPDEMELIVTENLSEDGSMVYTCETTAGNFSYGVALVKFKDFTLDTKEEREMMLTDYLDFLKNVFSIESFAGYGTGHQLATDESVEGIIDFWRDADGDEWSINAWVRNDGLAVMFIYGPEEYPNYSVSQFFFNSLKF